MLCSICKEKEATVHLTQIAGDKMQKVDLCEECAKTKGVNDPAGFSLADLLLGLGASQEIEQAGGGAEIEPVEETRPSADLFADGGPLSQVDEVTIRPESITGHAAAGGANAADVEFINRETAAFLEQVTEGGKRLN